MDEKLYSLDAEQAVLGACLFDGTAYDRVADIIRAEDFALRQHKLIWAAIEKLATDNTSTDIVTVEETLQTQGSADDAGGIAYLGKLARDVPSAANVESYAKIMVEYRIRRGLQAAGHKIASLAHADSDNRVADAYRELEALHDERKAAPVKAEEALLEFIEDTDRRFSADSEIIGLPTGVGDLDKFISGLCPGMFHIIAGRPSMGKSVLGQMAQLACAKAGKPSLMFELEMPRKDLIGRAAANLGSVPFERIRHPKTLTEDDWAKLVSFAAQTKDLPFWVDDSAGLHINDIAVRARRHKRQYGLDLVVIDYLQLVSGTGENRTQEISNVSRACKQLAKDLDVAVVALCQLNRSLEQRANKRPIMSDLKESGQLEQDADVIIFLYRDEVYHPDTTDIGIVELIIGKQRNGPIGTVKAAWLGQYARIDNLAFESMRNKAASAPEREFFV